MNILVFNPTTKSVKNVVRDLVYGCWCRGKRIGGMQSPPLNLLYVATVLKNEGHQVSFVDGSVDSESFEVAVKRAKDYRLAIFQTSTHSFVSDMEGVGRLKKNNPALLTVAFGSHPTFLPQASLEKGTLDLVVRREPEFVIRDLARLVSQKKGYQDLKGIAFRKKEKVVVNPVYHFIKNLDELPIPDRHFLPKGIDYFNPVVKRVPYTTMQTSRGCPGKCNFCTVPSFYGNEFRAQSAGRVVREMKMLKRQGYKEVFFRDETFTAFPKRNKEICLRIIKEGIDLTWVCNSRVDTISLEMMRLMKEAGCHMIKFGVESGVQKILDNINKKTRVDQTRKAFQWAHTVGIDTHAHVMLGCPGETKQTIKRTVEFIKEIAPTTATFGIHTPYPGTKLFERVAKTHPEIKDGTACDLAKIHTEGFFNESFTHLTKGELERSIPWAYRQFYFRPRYLLNWFKRLNSLEELRRISIAGTTILDFSLRGD